MGAGGRPLGGKAAGIQREDESAAAAFRSFCCETGGLYALYARNYMMLSLRDSNFRRLGKAERVRSGHFVVMGREFHRWPHVAS